MSARVIGAIGSAIGLIFALPIFFFTLGFGGLDATGPLALMLIGAAPGFLGAFAPRWWRPRPWFLAAAAALYAGPILWMFRDVPFTIEMVQHNLPENVLAYLPSLLLAWATLRAVKEREPPPPETAPTRGP